MRMRACAALCALLLLAACQKTKVDVGTAPTPIPNPSATVTGVSLTPGSETISECVKTIVFTATVNGSGAVQSVNWSHSGSTPDSFTSGGMTATIVIKTSGTYTVTATPTQSDANGISASTTITVSQNCTPAPGPNPSPSPNPGPSPSPDVRSISIAPHGGSGAVGTTMDVTATCTLNGTVVACSPDWSSSVTDRVAIVGPNPAQRTTIKFITAFSAEVCATWNPFGVKDCATFTGTAGPGTPTPPPPPPAAPKPTCHLSGNPLVIAQGGQSTLSWISTDATSFTPMGAWAGSSITTASGSRTVVLAQSATFWLVCTGAGGSVESERITITVLIPACPTSIDYSPKGGTVPVGATFALVVDNWPTGVSCVPFWYSSEPSRIQILGGDEIVIINGQKYFAGVNGQGKAIAAGTVQLSVQTSIAINSVSKSYTWTAVKSSIQGTQGKPAEPPLPKHNIYTDPDVCQTYPCRK